MSNSMPWVLGIASSHNGAACLLHGPELVVAIQEERLLRFKRAEHPARFPSLSVEYCLKQGGITADKLSAVVLCATAPTRNNMDEDIFLNTQLRVAYNHIQSFLIPHHFGHAVALHALSGMSSSGILIIDGNGSPWDELLESERAVIIPGQIETANRPNRTVPREIVSLYLANEGVITPIEKHISSYVKDPPPAPGMAEFQSLGDMYGFVGRQIFGSFFEGPGKVMGLAPYGKPVIPVEEFFRITSRGFEFQDTVRKRFVHDEHWPAHKEEYSDLAASVQNALETAVLTLAERMRREHEDLCYAGGVALNSVANERIVRECGFRDAFIMPAAEDSGTAIGAAYYGLWQLCGYIKRERQHLDNMGRTYSEAEINSAIQQLPGLVCSRSSRVLEETADLLAQGKILGWFQHGSEVGPRALGQRSILCDPRPPQMKDVLNQRVKFREGFRPFAPMILEEDVYEWFDVERPYGSSPFMLRVLPFRPEQASRVPAVVHVDGTGRVQTVSREAAPELHRLLTEFKKRTGVPLLLNTSFNIAGEPIVETPADALWCFLYTDMDACILGDNIVYAPRERDCVLDYPIVVSGAAFTLYGETAKGTVDFPLSPLHETDGRVLSAHLSRIEQLGRAAWTNKWLRLLAVVSTPWGQAIHGLPGGFMHILKLVDGRRTGREIYECVRKEAGYSPDSHNGNGELSKVTTTYTLAQFRRHIGLLKRIGAIGFKVEAARLVQPLRQEAVAV